MTFETCTNNDPTLFKSDKIVIQEKSQENVITYLWAIEDTL